MLQIGVFLKSHGGTELTEFCLYLLRVLRASVREYILVLREQNNQSPNIENSTLRFSASTLDIGRVLP